MMVVVISDGDSGFDDGDIVWVMEDGRMWWRYGSDGGNKGL